MLVLTRKTDEAIILELTTGEQIEVIVTAINGNQVRLGIEAPDAVEIMREELLQVSGG